VLFPLVTSTGFILTIFSSSVFIANESLIMSLFRLINLFNAGGIISSCVNFVFSTPSFTSVILSLTFVDCLCGSPVKFIMLVVTHLPIATSGSPSSVSPTSTLLNSAGASILNHFFLIITLTILIKNKVPI